MKSIRLKNDSGATGLSIHCKRHALLFVLVLFAATQSVNAQNTDEWLRQKKTQIRYLKKQIQGLQVYLELGRKGYRVVNEGLTVIGQITHGEWSLHDKYFNGSTVVNPRLKTYYEKKGNCSQELSRLLQNDYYRLTDGERFRRLQRLEAPCE